MTAWGTPQIPIAGQPARPTLFLDRDGVLVVDKHYLSDPDEVELIPGVCEALTKARQAGFLLIGVSNQSGLGRGRFTPNDLTRVMTRLDAMLLSGGSPLDGFFYCPHAPKDQCLCRKPLPGLLEEARLCFNWQAETSWVIGDKASDVELGRAHAMGSVLVRTGYGAEQETEVRRLWPQDNKVLIADNLPRAIDLVLSARNPEPLS